MCWVYRPSAFGITTMPAEAPATLLIQFARAPLAGQVKTRMIPTLSATEACDLHCALVRWTARQLVASGVGPVQLAVTSDAQHPLFQDCLAYGVGEVLLQRGADLGERMFHALSDALACFERVILVGSDCPGLDGPYLAQAVTALDQAPLVLGPAQDGGYVLIGARRIARELFEGIDWGSDHVYQQTVSLLAALGWNWQSLPEKVDIDRPEDLPQWHALVQQGG